jgi:hypothetical protein
VGRLINWRIDPIKFPNFPIPIPQMRGKIDISVDVDAANDEILQQ